MCICLRNLQQPGFAWPLPVLCAKRVILFRRLALQLIEPIDKIRIRVILASEKQEDARAV